jgi:hypothetical protein
MNTIALALPIGWALCVALISAVVAVALRKWAVGWGLWKRVLFAVAASAAPSFGIVVFFMVQLGPISLWFSPDEFLISFVLHILLIIAVATPIAWLISRRAARKPAPTDVFD